MGRQHSKWKETPLNLFGGFVLFFGLGLGGLVSWVFFLFVFELFISLLILVDFRFLFQMNIVKDILKSRHASQWFNSW